jgi:hypothetical protein
MVGGYQLFRFFLQSREAIAMLRAGEQMGLATLSYDNTADRASS